MRTQTIFVEEVAISTKWQELLEDAGRRRANAVAFFGGRSPAGLREIVLLNGEERHEIPVTDAQLTSGIQALSQAVLEPMANG